MSKEFGKFLEFPRRDKTVVTKGPGVGSPPTWGVSEPGRIYVRKSCAVVGREKA